MNKPEKNGTYIWNWYKEHLSENVNECRSDSIKQLVLKKPDIPSYNLDKETD